MPDTTFAQSLLALFTTPDRAAEIEGDLLEQRRERGSLWFAWQVIATSATLCLAGLRQRGGLLLLIAYATYELVLKLNWMVLLPVKRRMAHEWDLTFLVPELVRNGINGTTNFLLGMLLVRLSPRHGASVVLLAAGLMLGRVAILDSVGYALQMAVFGVTPALGGMLLMRWLQLRHPTSTLQVG
jgi:hypothetical protein